MKKLNSDSIAFYALAPSVEIVGRNECFVDGIKRIVKYEKENVIFEVGKYDVSLFGYNLYIDSFSGEGAKVRGTIISLEFIDNDKNNKMADGNA